MSSFIFFKSLGLLGLLCINRPFDFYIYRFLLLNESFSKNTLCFIKPLPTGAKKSWDYTHDSGDIGELIDVFDASYLLFMNWGDMFFSDITLFLFLFIDYGLDIITCFSNV